MAIKTLIVVHTHKYAVDLNKKLPDCMYAVGVLEVVMGRSADVIIMTCGMMSHKESKWFNESIVTCLSPEGILINQRSIGSWQ